MTIRLGSAPVVMGEAAPRVSREASTARDGSGLRALSVRPGQRANPLEVLGAELDRGR
jgi:hypothetical protein